MAQEKLMENANIGIYRRISEMKLSKKLPIVISLAALLCGSVVGYFSSEQTTYLVKEAAYERFKVLVDARKAAFDAYLDSTVESVHALGDTPSLTTAINRFSAAWSALGVDQTTYLQSAYIDQNPNPVGEKHKYMSAPDGTTYSAVHAKYHPWLKEFLEEHGLYDIFLVDTNGDVVYTVYKERDFATNLNNGQWKDSDLGKIYRQVMTLDSEDPAFVDFAPYAPSNNVPASFLAKHITNEDGKSIGALIFQSIGLP